MAAAAGLATMLTVIAVPEASAHDTCAAYGANVACVRNGHTGIDWCDRETDSNRVYAQYQIEFFGTITTGYDPNGSNPGCGHQDNIWPLIALFRVCEEGSGCSAWKEG
jgi:hypothetical protein